MRWLLTIPLLLSGFLAGCRTETVYIPEHDKVYVVVKGSFIDTPNDVKVQTPCEGYWVSKGTLMKLYEKARTTPP